jgi:hypothetical protein
MPSADPIAALVVQGHAVMLQGRAAWGHGQEGSPGLRAPVGVLQGERMHVAHARRKLRQGGRAARLVVERHAKESLQKSRHC